MRTFGAVVLCFLLCAFVLPLEARDRSCRSKCTQQIKPADANINIYTVANYVKFFEGLDAKCAKVKQARDCVDLCDDQRENPFASKAWRLACMESNLDAINSISPCLQEESDKVKKICQKDCGPTNAFDDDDSDEDDHAHSSRSRLRMVRLTSTKCSYMKCFLQCSRKEYSKSCPKVGDTQDVGDFIGSFYDRLMKASREEMTPLDTVADFIQRIRIMECSFLRNPTEVFDPPTMVGKTGSRMRGLFDSTMDSVQSFLDGFFKEFTVRS